MRIGPVVRAGQELHVHFNPVVQVRIYDPAGPIALQPTPEASRLERQIRSMPTVAPRVVQPVQTQSQSNAAVGCYKNTCHTISIICGVAVLPSFACVAIGPIGFVVPAALAVASALTYLIGGRETDGFRGCMDDIHADVESHDFR